jgi:hypothetical protein
VGDHDGNLLGRPVGRELGVWVGAFVGNVGTGVGWVGLNVGPNVGVDMGVGGSGEMLSKQILLRYPLEQLFLCIPSFSDASEYCSAHSKQKERYFL